MDFASEYHETPKMGSIFQTYSSEVHYGSCIVRIYDLSPEYWDAQILEI